ncbi:Phosphatidylinositol-4-phosphate 5-kinase [Cytospora paraplurivora]|uniref:1-phosphatidylinositol-4-phosphate 5-kinase n=1 Tax=Cytospora paraplurivora TaxID=2898453 RepID=A0AAN9YDL2_9PEZI
MPSFLNDHASPIHFQNAGVVHLNGTSQYEGISQVDIKVNGQQVPHINSHHTSNDSYDGSSSHSTRTSDSSDAAAQNNGDDTRTSTMSTDIAQNGAIDGGDSRKTNGFSYADANKTTLTNGAPITSSLPDRSLSPRPTLPNGTADRNSSHSFADPPSIRTSMASPTSSPFHPNQQQVHKGDGPAAGNANGSKANGGPSFQSRSSLDPNTPAPQRFSSPAQMSGTTTSLSSSTPNLHPTNAGLKHRHTLEVPRPANRRGSRDGQDTALASGRFSPTNTGARTASLNLVRRNTRSMNGEYPRDEAFPDEDAMRWAEAYRQKRASKKKRREEEEDDRVLVGTKVDEKHANWVTAYNMLTGIRVSVSRTNAKLDRPLTDADFESKAKTTFDITGNELVPSAKYDFKFKDYAPWVFRHLRQLFHLDPADYLMSLTGKYILSELGSPGKSGSFFYFSRDYRFIIKTIHHAEHKFLRKILKEYYNHVTANPNTLLSQFYGLHRVKTPWGRKIHFVVMNNLFPPHRDIHTTFDLKGSTIGRDYREEDLEKNPRATLKDLNWLRRQQHLELGLEKKRLFMEQLQKDVKLMQKLQIMDYSLLIGVHDVRKGNEENLRARNLQVFSPGGEQSAEDPHQVLMRTPSKLENQRRAAQFRQIIKSERPVPMGQSPAGMPDVLEEGAKSDSIFYSDDGGMQATHEDNSPGDEIYYLGVIDCLTHYGVIKKIEHFWKGLSHDRTQISALPPEQYGDRFLNFMSGITMSPEEAAREAEERKNAEAQAAAEQTKQRVPSWNSVGRKSTSSAAPTHQPPPPPGRASGALSPQEEETMRRAEHVAHKSERHGHTEAGVPEVTMKPLGDASTGIFPSLATASAPSLPTSNGQVPHGRESANHPSLPIVQESGESLTNGQRSHSASQVGQSNQSRMADGRPVTPAKDGRNHGFGNPMLSNVRQPMQGPPTPPKTSGSMAGNGSGYYYGKRLMKPESADSGIGVHGMGPERPSSQHSYSSGRAGFKGQLGRDSMDKALPPLPGPA